MENPKASVENVLNYCLNILKLEFHFAHQISRNNQEIHRHVLS